jgi:hypothetical protein
MQILHSSAIPSSMRLAEGMMKEGGAMLQFAGIQSNKNNRMLRSWQSSDYLCWPVFIY